MRDGECTSQACPLEHGDDSPAVEGEGGVCCNEGLNGCSGHGVCTMHSDSTTPRSLGPAAAVPFGGCVCDKEWTGSDCSQWMMPAHIFLAWRAVVSFLIFGTLSWCAVWLRWFLATHRAPEPPAPASPPQPPTKPERDSSSETDSDTDDELGVSCRLSVFICCCTELPSAITLGATGRSKRSRTIVNGGISPTWSAGAEPHLGEEVGWYIPRGHHTLHVEVWRGPRVELSDSVVQAAATEEEDRPRDRPRGGRQRMVTPQVPELDADEAAAVGSPSDVLAQAEAALQEGSGS